MAIIKEGDKAPEFQLADKNQILRLADYRGKKVVLYFYPKDNTPGCTAEACNLRDRYQLLVDNGFVIIGVSADSDVSHQKFIEKYQLPFPLIPDVDKKIIQAYGVWGEKKFMGKQYMGIHRVTFVIDEKGFVEKVFEKVKTGAHSEQILDAYGLKY